MDVTEALALMRRPYLSSKDGWMPLVEAGDALAAEVEKLRADNAHLLMRVREQTAATQESAQFWHDAVLAKLQSRIPEGIDPQGHPIEQIVGMVLSVMDGEVEKLRAALGPFANLGRFIRPETWEDTGMSFVIPAKHFRAAAEAMGDD